MWHLPHVSATLTRATFDPGSFALRIAWLPWQSWHSGAFVFPWAIAFPWAESKYARTLSDWGAPSWFPLKWQWVQVTRRGRTRCGISLTSKWQSVHPFFPWTDPFSVSPVTKRSRIWPSTSNLRNSGLPWHRVHFSSEIEAEASRGSPGRPPHPRANRTAARANFLIRPLPL